MTSKVPASIQSISEFLTKARSLVAQMNLEEKATLLSGDGWWKTHGIARLGIPSIMMTDGPHGLRKVTSAGLSTSVPATCFPTASALASSWNTQLLENVGVSLATEAQANDIQIILGPGINMKRSPLGGRNFEYFSEDPLLAGKLAAAYINGVQSQGVGTSLKHFAANNQEFERMVTDSILDERTLHEIYFSAFEIAIKESQPWSVMCSYNKINGVQASENRLLLREILKDQWGLTGFVVSDWGAVVNRVAGVNAGLHLEMPGSGEYNRKKIVAAIESGEIQVAQLDRIVSEFLAILLLADQNRRADVNANLAQHHLLARSSAAESMVLLKNADQILPLDFSSISKLAVIGTFAKYPRYQGAGSSQVNPTQVLSPYDELAKSVGEKISLVYSEGYGPEGVVSDDLIQEACDYARTADATIIFAGLPDSYESEGFDRSSLGMPEGHNKLIESVSQVQPNVIVVLMNGSAASLPWEPKVKAILEAWLGGQAVGGAVADVLTGRVNPSGKLSETFPFRLEDTPVYPEFPATNKEAVYGEGLFIGYRHYDKRGIAPHFPFGFGLSFTTFAYSGVQVSPARLDATGVTVVQATIKNTGKVAGKEIVQLYIREQKAKLVRPEKELKAFAKVALNPGEEKMVRFELDRKAFAYFDVSIHNWNVNPGKFDILIGPSSNSLPLHSTIEIQVEQSVHPQLKPSSLLKEFRDHPNGNEFFDELIGAFRLLETDEPTENARTPEQEAARKKSDMATMAFLNDMPANKAMAFSEGRFSEERLNEILRQSNSPAMPAHKH
jgi:beta-glucosidase